MNWFVRFALIYLGIVCVLTWFRDDPISATAVAMAVFVIWTIKKGWVTKLIRATYRRIQANIRATARDTQVIDGRELVSQWNRFVDGTRIRPLAFYSVLEHKIAARNIPKLRSTRIYLPETGPLSAKREYLRLRRKDLEFYICGAPFGTGFSVSTRLFRIKDLTFGQKVVAILLLLILALVLAKLIEAWLLPVFFGVAVSATFYFALTAERTCYEADMAETFKQAVHNCVMQAIDELTSIRPIMGPAARGQSPPLMAELFR